MTRNIRLIGIITALAIAFLIGNIVLFNLTPKPRRVTQPIAINYGISDPQFHRTMNAILHQPITYGNKIEIMSDGPEIYPAVAAAIDNAKHSITLETFQFWGPGKAGTAYAKCSYTRLPPPRNINDEANINIYHDDFARKIRELIETDMDNARRYDLEQWKQRPWYNRLYGRVSMILGPHY